MTDVDLASAARFELEQREKHYPASVASGKLIADEATLDFQAWAAIAAFLDSGQSPAGWLDGAAKARTDPSTALIEVEWLLCEAACDRAIAQTGEALKKAAGQDEAKAGRLTTRLAQLQQIGAIVRRERGKVERLNRAWRERRQLQQQAAA